MTTKIELRKKAKEIRKNLDIKKFSDELTEKIRLNSAYINSQNVMLFYPTPEEVNLLGLLNDNKNFYFPRVEGKNLKICPYNCGDKLKKSDLNIFEPYSSPVKPEIPDLVIVPALMADKRGFRLGYGGGYYDRFLADNKIKTLCAIPKPLLVEEIPTEDFDIPVDIVIS